MLCLGGDAKLSSAFYPGIKNADSKPGIYRTVCVLLHRCLPDKKMSKTLEIKQVAKVWIEPFKNKTPMVDLGCKANRTNCFFQNKENDKRSLQTYIFIGKS